MLVAVGGSVVVPVGGTTGVGTTGTACHQASSSYFQYHPTFQTCVEHLSMKRPTAEPMGNGNDTITAVVGTTVYDSVERTQN